MTLSAQQHADRQQGIGGSDVAALLGLHPKNQAIDVFYDKRPDLAEAHGYVAIEVGGDPVDFGNYVEDPVAQLYMRRTGKKVRRSNNTIIHKDFDWLRANIDRDIVGERCGLEIKSVSWPSAPHWGPDGTDEVAEYYLPQVMHYMLVLDYDCWDVAALIGGAVDFRIYHLERNAEWDDMIIDTASTFWHGNVLAGIPPEIDPEHRAAADVIKRVYSLVDSSEITLPPEAEHWHQVRQDALAQIKNYQSVADVAKHHLEALAGNCGRFRIPNVPGAYLRERRHRDAYEVAACDYITTRYSKRIK